MHLQIQEAYLEIGCIPQEGTWEFSREYRSRQVVYIVTAPIISIKRFSDPPGTSHSVNILWTTIFILHHTYLVVSHRKPVKTSRASSSVLKQTNKTNTYHKGHGL